jgi:hypothetical protein
MSEDIAKDPEYIRGYEEAKRSIEREKSPYYQGRKAAFKEEVNRENESISVEEIRKKDEFIPASEVIMSEASFRKELIDILREFVALEKRNMQDIRNIDERLKKLERYSQE